MNNQEEINLRIIEKLGGIETRLDAIEARQTKVGNSVEDLKAWADRWKGAAFALLGIGGAVGSVITFFKDKILP